MIRAYIGLGSNLGDSLQILLDGWQSLGETSGIFLETISSPYRTEPVAMASPNWFINAAGSVRTTLSPADLLASLLQVEARFGRKRSISDRGYRDRSLDFDLLLYGMQIVSELGLEIPHPLMHTRLFVLAPLREIAGEVIHPVRGEPMGDLFDRLTSGPDHPAVEKMDWPEGCPDPTGLNRAEAID